MLISSQWGYCWRLESIRIYWVPTAQGEQQRKDEDSVRNLFCEEFCFYWASQGTYPRILRDPRASSSTLIGQSGGPEQSVLGIPRHLQGLAAIKLILQSLLAFLGLLSERGGKAVRCESVLSSVF